MPIFVNLRSLPSHLVADIVAIFLARCAEEPFLKTRKLPERSRCINVYTLHIRRNIPGHHPGNIRYIFEGIVSPSRLAADYRTKSKDAVKACHFKSTHFCFPLQLQFALDTRHIKGAG